MADDFEILRERARGLVARKDFDGALSALVPALGKLDAQERDYVPVAQMLERTLLEKNDPQGAISVLWYLWSVDRLASQRAQTLLPRVAPVDRGRTLALAGDLNGAAREMEEAGRVATAAIYREKAGDFRGARALWSRLSGSMATGADAYSFALVHFNLARCAKQCGDKKQTREAIVSAIRLLEEAADHFESIGQRERAFDCFQVLVQIGRESGSFEDVLEGFVNCIRILREDGLKYFAMQYMEDAIDSARKRGEFSAAATLAGEAAEYARSVGLSSTSTHYALMRAELWLDVAKQGRDRGSPPEIIENALLAGILAFGELEQFARVGRLYVELSGLPLEDVRQRHYARAAERYTNVRDEPTKADPLPSNLRQPNHFPDVWHVDVIEWEERGNAAETCAGILLESDAPDVTRRRALVARLSALFAERTTGAANIHFRTQLAQQLGDLQLYAVLSPLESLFRASEAAVRIAVLNALQHLFFKRTFITVRAAIRDPDPAVVENAGRTIRGLRFQHGFDPLSRIVREASQATIRGQAIRALSEIDTVEAAEFLLGILDHGSSGDKSAAIAALRETRGTKFSELADAEYPSASSSLQELLRQIKPRRVSLGS